jgi:HAD superfamily hydrolase (TIGR01490 family)
MSRPFAAFDIDGTVIRWQLYHAISDAMVKQGIIKREAFEPVHEARMSWKRRADDNGFKRYEAALVECFDEAITGLPEATFQSIADEVFEEYCDQVYTYTRDLIKDLKRQDYLLLAISGSPAGVVKRFVAHYGFDDYAATEYPVKDGKLLGTKDVSVGKKAELLQSMVSKHQVGFEGSIGVGDSEGDIGMLDLVERPIAMNPSQQLLDHAQKRGWEVVVERKNVIYRLEQRNGSYVLATTTAE